MMMGAVGVPTRRDSFSALMEFGVAMACAL
jgi:hypothetical protein